MAWMALDTAFFSNDEVCDVTLVTRYAVISVIAYTKAHGARGCVKATPSQISRTMQVPIKNIQDALKTSLFETDGKKIQVVNWQGFQRDSTAAERQAKFRDKQKDDVTDVTLRNAGNGCYADRTVQDSTTTEESDKILERAENHVAALMSISDRACNMDFNRQVAKAVSDCNRFSDRDIVLALEEVGKDAHGWGLISDYLRKQSAQKTQLDVKKQLREKEMEEQKKKVEEWKKQAKT